MAGEVVAEHVGAITIVAGADRASGETHWTVMMKPVDYDVVAPAYDTRYERNRYDGVRDVLQRFIGEPGSVDAAEVGCGTGHWLAEIRGRIRTAAGLDLSAEMLQRARAAAPFALVVRGRAEKLPWAAGSFDRIFCINALHHFGDADAFIIEARRVLRPSGALMIIGLDPHTELDTWWIYDYFPAALKADRARYLSTATIRGRLEAAGLCGSGDRGRAAYARRNTVRG